MCLGRIQAIAGSIMEAALMSTRGNASVWRGRRLLRIFQMGTGGLGIVGTVLLIVVVMYMFGGFH